MRSQLRRSLTTVALAGLLLTTSAGVGSAHGTESHASFGMKLMDATLVRPFSAVGATLGSALFVATAPLTFFTGVGVEANQVLMLAPWRFTAGRYLGDFNSYKDARTVTGRLQAR